MRKGLDLINSVVSNDRVQLLFKRYSASGLGIVVHHHNKEQQQSDPGTRNGKDAILPIHAYSPFHAVKVIQEPGPDALKLVKLHFNLTAVKGAAIRDDFHRLCYCILLKIIQFTFITIPILQPPEEGTYISVIHKQGDPLNPMRIQLMMLEVPCKKIIQKYPGKFIF